MTYQEQQIQEAYKAKQEEIQKNLYQLANCLTFHSGEKQKDWGHHGDLNHVNNELIKLIDFMKS